MDRSRRLAPERRATAAPLRTAEPARGAVARRGGGLAGQRTQARPCEAQVNTSERAGLGVAERFARWRLGACALGWLEVDVGWGAGRRLVGGRSAFGRVQVGVRSAVGWRLVGCPSCLRRVCVVSMSSRIGFRAGFLKFY